MNALYTPEACEQRRLRIRIALAAYMYEYHAYSFMSDGDYDALSKKIDTSIGTGNQRMDKFFQEEFSPDTGQWIHRHPERHKLEIIYNHHYEGK